MNKTILKFNPSNQFEFPNNQFLLKESFLQYKKDKKRLNEFKKVENYFKKYTHIFAKNDRPAKALPNLKYCTWFFYPPNATFKIAIALEGLILIFLLDEIADNNKYSLSYRKRFLENFIGFLENISFNSNIQIGTTDLKQKEMREVWFNYFKKIYYRKDSEKNKWIESVKNFIQAMLNELENKKYNTLKKYLGNSIFSSGALFYWQSIITNANFEKQNGFQYNKLTKKVATILRLTNDFAWTNEDKNKITALNFCNNKNELENIIKKELKEFQKMLEESITINKEIRIAMWRSAIFLYYFYKNDNF